MLFVGFWFTVWPMSVPEFMRESIVLCSTCRTRMSSWNSSCSLFHLL